jgi:cyclopropane-fatty-acyl-phospholipid synthase
MAYSCGVFLRSDATLEEAQAAKYERICEQLRLSPSDHLLEIGTGWGGFALHAARTRGCRVTSTTISREQHAFAVEKIQDAGLSERVTVLLQDYRDLEGSFDKAVSIEMFEAVGLRFYDTYFAQVDRLLKPDGAFLLQTITMNERRFPDYIRSTDWIQQYVFPGAELSSLLEIHKSLARATNLGVFFVEDLGAHYAHTLAAWRERFHARSEDVRALGFDAAFQRLWDYYLASCEGAFRERYIGVVQMLLAKRNAQRSLLREPWSIL